MVLQVFYSVPGFERIQMNTIAYWRDRDGTAHALGMQVSGKLDLCLDHSCILGGVVDFQCVFLIVSLDVEVSVIIGIQIL